VNEKIGPILQNPGRVLLHLLMMGLLSQVVNKNTELVCAREVNDKVGVLVVLAMLSVIVNNNTELVCARGVKDNVGVLAVLAMLSVIVNKNTELVCAREVKDIFLELPFGELEEGNMGQRIESGGGCPLLTKGKRFELGKREVVEGCRRPQLAFVEKIQEFKAW
jgi:hypothetical protein